jgi:nucleoside-diphosphate-sugar epimerase
VVTGASGWLGVALVEALAAEGRRLRCLVPALPDTARVEAVAGGAVLDVVVGDVRDPTAIDRLFEGADAPSVFHAAAVIHPAGRTREFFDVNVGGTALVVDRAARHGARRLVHVSSNSPFGYSRDPGHRFDEDSAYHPHLGYGASKMEAEQLVLRAHDRGRLETAVVRAPWFYGPHQPERQTRFFAAVRRGLFPLCGDGTNQRSLAYTGNLVQGLLLVERHEKAAGRPWWIADARSYSMTEILAAVKQALAAEGLPVADRQLRLPGIACEVAGLADRLAQGVGRYVQPAHVLSEMNKTIACSVERAREELGYEPVVELGEGMRRSVRWALDAGLAL